MRFNSSGVVKLYNFQRGFGFFTPDAPVDRDMGDVVVYRRVLRLAGIRGLIPDSRIACAVEKGETGLYAVQVLDLQPPPDDGGARLKSSRDGLVVAETSWLDGEVKFFKSSVGYGFVMVEQQPRDAFVHAEALQKYGIGDLRAGDRVQVRLGRGRNGPIVVGLRYAKAHAHA